MKKIFVFLIIISSTACGSSDNKVELWDHLPIPVTIDSEENQQVIDLYNSMFSEPVFIKSNSDNAIKIVYVAPEEIDDGDDHTNLGRTEYKYDESGVYDVVIKMNGEISPPDHNNRSYPYVFAHELGHALGAKHMESGIMESGFTYNAQILENLIDDGLTQWIEENYGIERIKQ